MLLVTILTGSDVPLMLLAIEETLSSGDPSCSGTIHLVTFVSQLPQSQFYLGLPGGQCQDAVAFVALDFEMSFSFFDLLAISATKTFGI